MSDGKALPKPAHDWRAAFGDAMPTGHRCRAAMPDRWLRIHSLPGSRRYPDDAHDRRELLLRQNAVAGHVLGEGETCWLFFARVGADGSADPSTDPLLPGLMSQYALTTVSEEEPVRFFAAYANWRSGAFDALIMAIAEGVSGPVLFANTARSAIYAPYEGGADLFLPSPAALEVARGRFAAWRSLRPDGL